MMAFDCETNGLNVFHGNKPFMLTTCDESGDQKVWIWEVNPLTRQPTIPPGELREIKNRFAITASWGKSKDEELRERHVLIAHNAKFDVEFLTALGVEVPWPMVRDTLLAAHLLASNQPKDLTALVTTFFGKEEGEKMQGYEDATEQAVNECRRMVQQARLKVKRAKSNPKKKKVPKEQAIRFTTEGGIVAEDLFGHDEWEEVAVEESSNPIASWRIADTGLAEMPSLKEKKWKADLWLPRAMVKHLWETSQAGVTWAAGGLPHELEDQQGWEYRPPGTDGEDDKGHPWWTVTRDYANTDSAVTVALWPVLKAEIVRRGLWKIYLERLKLLPVLQRMETRGVTVSKSGLEELRTTFQEDSATAHTLCTNLAASYNHTCPDCVPTEVEIAKAVYDHKAKPEIKTKCDTCGGTRLASYCLELPKNGVNASLRIFCFDVMKLPPYYSKKSKTAAPTLDKNAIEQYLNTLPKRGKQRKFIEALRRKRKCDTALSYLESYEKFWLPTKNSDTFVLHGSVNATGTDTLRMSMQNPNTAQISKQEEINLRYAFGVAFGREGWSLDAKNVELRLPAYKCKEQELIKLFESPDDSPYYGSEHLLNFSTVYPDIWQDALDNRVWEWEDGHKGERVTLATVGPYCKKKYKDTYYQWCKNGDFAVGYGAIDRAGGGGTADQSFHRTGSHARLTKRFANKEKLNQEYIRYASKYGYVETYPDRTVDPSNGYPLLCTRTEWGRILPTVPLNYAIQGTAVWVASRQLVIADAELSRWRREGFDAWLVMYVHDELVLELPYAPDKGNLPRIMGLKKLLEVVGDDLIPPVPVVMGVEYHVSNWGEGETCA